jgi:hypothetical protein
MKMDDVEGSRISENLLQLQEMIYEPILAKRIQAERLRAG